MWHSFKYTLKTLFKNKMLIFWTFAFPIILGTLFYMAFSDIENNEKLDIINIAIVDNEYFNENQVLKESFHYLGDNTNENKLFNIEYVNDIDAKSLLENGKIEGYLIPSEKSKIVVKENGINETILKYVTEEIVEVENIIKNTINYEISNQEKIGDLTEFYTNIYNEVLEIKNEHQANIKNVSSNNLSYTMIEYYTLIAMTCLYGGILSMTAINQNLANMSEKGKRVSISPTSKAKLILSSTLASYLTQLIGILILFLYTIFVLKVDYGNHLLKTVVLALVGCLSGLSLGVMISSVFKASEGTKVGIIIAFTMVGSFLSGMMGITMKYIIDKNIPILNKINPASMITDGFYSLYYYDTFNRYYFNIASLLIFSFVMIAISIICLRRQKYDSI